MNTQNILIYALSLFFTFGCTHQKVNEEFLGFWEGPHPENIEKKFYVQLSQTGKVLQANGFWTENNFYNESFEVDSITLYSDSLRFYIPGWGCYYSGKLINNNLIRGGFLCEGEPFDTVYLSKNDEMKHFLTEAKPGCTEEHYKYVYDQPRQYDDMVETGHFASTNDSLFIHTINSEIIKGKYGRINSFLLMKHGKLICEEYFYGYSRSGLHQIESSTKSITSLLVGIAKDKGFISDINQPLYEIFPNYRHLRNGDYRNITIKNLLTMSSGFKEEYDKLLWSDNRIEYALNRKLDRKVGTEFVYDGGNTELLGAILKLKTGMYADEFAKKFLFELLGTDTFNWDTFRQNEYPCMGGSLELTSRDMAKIGLMVLNGGRFNHNQVISKDWIAESTSKHISTHITGDDYGYHWWNISLNSGNKHYKTIWANGLGSQFIYIIPELDVVIVTTGYNYENDSWAISEGIGKYLYLLEQ